MDREGTLHVVWLEPEDSAGPEIFEGLLVRSARRMLYANYRDSRWSEAEQIARAQFFFPHGRSGLRVDRDGILHLAFSSFSGDFIPVHLRRVGQDWTLGVIPGYDGPDFSHGQDIGYESLVLGPGERLSLAYTSGARSARDPTLRGQPNHVFFRGSEDGGRTWNDPVLVMPSRGRPAMQLQLVPTRGDTLHLVWVRAPRGGTPIAESIEHVYSADGGLTWSESDRMPLPAGLRGIGTLAAMADPDGELHVTPWLETDPPGCRDLRLSYTVQTPCADPAPPPRRPPPSTLTRPAPSILAPRTRTQTRSRRRPPL